MSSATLRRGLLLINHVTGGLLGGVQILRTNSTLRCLKKRCGPRIRHSFVYDRSLLFVSVIAVFLENATTKTNVQKQKDFNKPLKNTMKANIQDIKKTADALHRKKKVFELYSFLKQYAHYNDPDILWRLARAARDTGNKTADKPERRKLMFEAFEYAKKALDQDHHNSNCHRWYAILLDQTAQYQGLRTRLGNAFTVRKHFEKAIELDPNDAVSLHSVGYWCFAFADFAWYERKVLEALFSCPPRSTYEEALTYFEKAEEADPKFLMMNLVMLGKTHLRLGNYDKATEYLTEAYRFPLLTPDDEVAYQEATHLLSKLGHKTNGA